MAGSLRYESETFLSRNTFALQALEIQCADAKLLDFGQGLVR